MEGVPRGANSLRVTLAAVLLVTALPSVPQAIPRTAVTTLNGVPIAFPRGGAVEVRSPRFLGPLVLLGRRSYKACLVHVFVVFAFFNFFVSMGKPLRVVPVLFITVIAIAGWFGDVIARFYLEPMNHTLRGRLKLGSVAGETTILESR